MPKLWYYTVLTFIFLSTFFFGVALSTMNMELNEVNDHLVEIRTILSSN